MAAAHESATFVLSGGTEGRGNSHRVRMLLQANECAVYRFMTPHLRQSGGESESTRKSTPRSQGTPRVGLDVNSEFAPGRWHHRPTCEWTTDIASSRVLLLQEGRPVRLALIAGQAGDAPAAEGLPGEVSTGPTKRTRSRFTAARGAWANIRSAGSARVRSASTGVSAGT